MMRKLTFILAAATAALAAAAASPAPAGTGDNAAVAVNLRDGSSTFRLAFRITRVNRDVVDTGNAAVAVASCTDCQTVAVAIQAVLIFSDAEVVAPTNLALALNLECSRCYTLASAYQFVSTTGVVHFTAEGNRRIAEIRRELEELRHSGLAIEEIQARVDVLAAELAGILRTELVVPGAHAGHAEDGVDSPRAAAEPMPTTAVAGSGDDGMALGDGVSTSNAAASDGSVADEAGAVEATSAEPETPTEVADAAEPATGPVPTDQPDETATTSDSAATEVGSADSPQSSTDEPTGTTSATNP
jgi:putative peptide zinc metalloprotease protein